MNPTKGLVKIFFHSRSEAFSAKPMSSEEASLQLDVSDKDFLVFQDSKSKKINVIYKRPDGYHGLVEPGV